MTPHNRPGPTTPTTPPYGDIHQERRRAHQKHDGNGDSMERKTFDDPSWLSVLVEEVGEVAMALCDHRHHGQYTDRQAFARDLRSELVQVAAMAAAWIDAIDLDDEHLTGPREGA